MYTRLVVFAFAALISGHSLACTTQVLSDGSYIVFDNRLIVADTNGQSPPYEVTASCYCKVGDSLISGGCGANKLTGQIKGSYPVSNDQGAVGWGCMIQLPGQDSVANEAKIRLLCKHT